MSIYAGEKECQIIYVSQGGVARRVSSVWVGDKQVFPPANRQEIHAFSRDTQGYSRDDYGTHFGYTVPVPWWATNMDVVIIGAGEKGQDGTKSFIGGEDGAGGRSGAWVVKTVALNPSTFAVVYVGKGTSTSPHVTAVYLPGGGGQADVMVHDGEGVRTPNDGSSGGHVTPQSRTEYNQTHVGGARGTRNNPGRHPGGGGGGGQGSNLLGNPTSGQPGGDGYVWLRFRSADGINPGDDEFVLRVGVSSGVASAALHEWAVGIGESYETVTEITVPVEVVGPSLQSLFRDCYALTSIPDLDTSQVTDMYAMFSGCQALTSVTELDAHQVRKVGHMFRDCSSLESVTLPGMGDGFDLQLTLDMKATKLSAAAANALMQSFGTPPLGGSLRLPATATGADTSIAAAKNWTVTVG